VLILVSVGDASDDPVVIDHVAFRVESLAAVAGRGLVLEPWRWP
jgi:hypothetical protein